MLNIGKLGAGAERYYLETVASGVEDYYTGSGEAPGYWLGSDSASLGLVGLVEAEDLRAALSGADPESGERLTASAARTVPGFDLTFRAPKGVSLLYGLGDADTSCEARRAHDAAVVAALRYLEEQAGWSRRGAQGRERVPVAGFVAAAFRHRSSRAGDPLLHTHVVVSNLGRAVDDGRWRTLDARHLYLHAKTAGYLYQAALRHELSRRLGVEWGPVVNGCADLAGIPDEVVRAFSRRRSEIETRMAERGESSARAAQAATLATRKAKDYGVAAGALRDGWRDRAEGLGFGWRQVAALSGREVAPALVPHIADAIAAELAGPQGLTERASTFTRRDVVRAWCERLPAGADAAAVAALADGFLDPARGPAVRLLDPTSTTIGSVVRRGDGRVVRAGDEPRYSTPELLALERQVLDRSVERADAGVAVADAASVQAALRRRPSLTDEQAAMVRRLTASGAGVDVVVGKAGAGKTFALDAARDAWHDSGVRVLGCALAARAAAGLQDGAGIPSATLDALLMDLDRGGDAYRLPAGSVVVVDEAGMVGTRKLARLLDHADRSQAKVVLVGDHRQLPEIDAGGIFRGLATRQPAIELTDNRRQQHAWEREALDELRAGDPTAAVDAYTEHGRVVVGDTAEAVRERLVADWWAAHGDTDSDHDAERVGDAGVMVAARVADVDDLNARARHRLVAAGLLTGPTLTAGERNFRAGDRALLLRNDRRLGVTNGDRATVTAVDPHVGTVTVDLERSGRAVTLPARYLEHGHLSHAYAMTAHKAQGATVKQAWVMGSDAAYREWGYVALSRARDSTRLYLVGTGDARDDQAPRPITDPVPGFAEALSRSQAQHLALDHGDASTQASRRQLHAARLGSLRDRLRCLNEALNDARHTLAALSAERDARREQVDDLARGVRRLLQRGHARQLETELHRIRGHIASWQDRIDTVSSERAALIERIARESSAAPRWQTSADTHAVYSSREQGDIEPPTEPAWAQPSPHVDHLRGPPELDLGFG